MLCTKMDEKWLIFSFIPNILHIFIMSIKNLENIILYYSKFSGLVIYIYIYIYIYIENVQFL